MEILEGKTENSDFLEAHGEGIHHLGFLTPARAEENAVYFHCASNGKKMEILRKNPRVWCLAVIDNGLGPGICQNLYASVMFSGMVTFPENVKDKISALRKQIENSGGKVEESLKRLENIVSKSDTINNMAVGRIQVTQITGKRSTYTI